MNKCVIGRILFIHAANFYFSRKAKTLFFFQIKIFFLKQMLCSRFFLIARAIFFLLNQVTVYIILYKISFLQKDFVNCIKIVNSFLAELQHH